MRQRFLKRYFSQATNNAKRDYMRVIQVSEPGGTEMLQYATNALIPTCSSNQILVKNQFAGINFIDTYFRKGLYAKPMPFTLGLEGGGEVIQVGENVKNFKVGHRVSYPRCHSGSYAEYTSVDEFDANPVPEDVELDVAIALAGIQGMTAHYLACSTYPLTPEHTCVITAAGGGVGQLLIQVAKIRGAKVIAVTSSGKIDMVKECGADEICSYDDYEEFTKSIGGAHVVYDSVGKDTSEKSLNCLKPLGLYVAYGNSTGAVPPIDPLSLTSRGSLFMTRPTLFHYISSVEAKQKRLDDLYSWYQQGKINVRMDQRFKLMHAAQCHEYLESGQSHGKLFLDTTRRFETVQYAGLDEDSRS